MIGYVYNFFPVEIDENNPQESSCDSIEESWQWKYFAWLFWVIWAGRYITATAMGIDDYFTITIRKERK